MKAETKARHRRLKLLKAERARLAAEIAVLENRKRLIDECIVIFEKPLSTDPK